MYEITPDELYQGLLAHGLFSEKLPPIFSSECFFEYCQSRSQSFTDKGRQYIFYENMRNTNVPRQLGIPNPMAYQLLCRCLADNLDTLCRYFYEMTSRQSYKVSRIHIRKLKYKTTLLFNMNYKNWKTDGSPEPDLLIGKRWMVKADISNCFPSIYTHSLSWALVGKENAKINRSQEEWYNKIDHFSQNIKNGETHGLIIGPLSSNLLSEIILTKIDNELSNKGWKYIRKIDDYSCYVPNYKDCQKFLADLNRQLRQYDLTLNHKKTEILELPIAAVEQWVRQIKSVHLSFKSKKANYKEVMAYLDSAVELMRFNNGNSAILNYAIKMLRHQSMTENAKKYIVKTVLHLAFLYQYLIPLLKEYVFDAFNVCCDDISKFSNFIFESGLDNINYEAVSYALFFAIKYKFKLNTIKIDKIIESDNCIVKLLAYKYFESNSDSTSCKKLKNNAENMTKDNIEKNWLFVYEILPQSKLHKEWKQMKSARVSFLKPF
jgi:hypothetical protein